MGWQEAWLAAVRLSSGTAKDGGGSDEPLSPFPEMLLSEEAGADFDRIVRAKLGRSPPNDHVAALNTTLKLPVQTQSDFAFNSIPKHTASGLDIATDSGKRCCISDAASSISESDDNVHEERIEVGYSPSEDECGEAQRAVFAQHRTVTMKRLNKTTGRGMNTPQIYHNQASTFAVSASVNDDIISLSRSIQHSGSLNDLTFNEDGLSGILETTLFEQVSSNSHLLFVVIVRAGC